MRTIDDARPTYKSDKGRNLRPPIALFCAAICIILDFAKWYSSGHGLYPSNFLDMLFDKDWWIYLLFAVGALAGMITAVWPSWPTDEAG